MRNYYKYKNSKNNNKNYINQEKNETNFDTKIEIKNNTSYLKKKEFLPDIPKNNKNSNIYSNCFSNQVKLASSVCNKYAYLYKNQSNNFSNKSNLNRNLKKEKIKICREKTPEIKDEESYYLKIDNNTLNKKIENIEKQFFQFKKDSTSEINEIKKNNLFNENLNKSKFIEILNNIDSKFNSLNESIKRLNEKSISINNKFEDYKIKKKELKDNNNNLLNKIFLDIEFLKKQIDEKNKTKSNTEFYGDLKETYKNELIELNKEKESLKLVSEKLNLKYKEIDIINIELKKRNEEFKHQNEELKKQNTELKRQNEEMIKQNIELKNQNKKLIEQKEEIKDQNIELKRQNEKLIKQKEELKKQNEEIINLNDKLKKQNNKIIKENTEITKQKEDLIKKNEEIRSQNDKIETKKEGFKNLNKETINEIENIKKVNEYYEKKYAIVGLKNVGNSCYMNSVLQILKNIPQFTYNIIKLKDNQDKFLIQLKNLFVNLCSPNITVFSPKEFKKSLGLEKSGKIFSGNEQYDSNIFYLALLNIIDKKLNNKKIIKIDMSKYKGKTIKERQIIYKENDYSFKEETFIFDTFYIYFVNEIKCKNCKHLTQIFQKNNFFDFPIVTSKGNVKSLEECFDNYQKIKDVKDTCSECKSFGITHESILLELPPILMINLKRVGEQSVYYNDIEIPDILNIDKIIKNPIKISTSIYELRGFIKHDGDEKSGHNYAFCKNMFDNKWYEFNDSICREINGKPNLDKIFFLCYIKAKNDNDNFDYLEGIINSLNKENKK